MAPDYEIRLPNHPQPHSTIDAGVNLLIQWIRRKREDKRAKIILWANLVLLIVLVALWAMFAGALASQAPNFLRWTIGLVFAVATGQIACRWFLRALREDYMRMKKPHGLGPSRGVPPAVVGTFESLVFSVAVGAVGLESQALAGVFTVMGLWLAAKMLAGWNRDLARFLLFGDCGAARKLAFVYSA